MLIIVIIPILVIIAVLNNMSISLQLIVLIQGSDIIVLHWPIELE